MATQKRRVVYLSDEEWAKVQERGKAFGLSASAYIGKLIEWRQPGPVYIETGVRGADPMPIEAIVSAPRGPAGPSFGVPRPAPRPSQKGGKA